MTVRIVGTAREWATLRRPGARVAFVPTMGALHEGHGALVRAARAHGDMVVASIFVNPTQFGPTEDLARYPRDLEGDRAKLAAWGCDVLFHPTAEAMYRQGLEAFRIHPPAGLGDFWCGLARPGHLAGVCTVVAKLLGMVRPDVALFGQKDFQQWRIVEALVDDLCLGTRIVRCPTIREPDGVAMSSRNTYLSPTDRIRARALSGALAAVLGCWRSGERDILALEAAGKQAWIRLQGKDPELGDLAYLEVRHQDLTRPALLTAPGVAAMAAQIGPARLIDNVLLEDHSPDLPLLELA
ncbi:MAG: pantoate--beta-alanine ligase [Candidatus Sericytochromatia bacterium]|nr:pantoate--beta-alanine ligase [Candidatus Tanganyikabacteria bacterium]